MDHVEQPRPPVEGHDAGRVGSAPGGGGGQERGLVYSQRGYCVKPVGVIDQRGAVLADRGHHRRPADPEVGGHPGHGVPVLSDPPARLPPGPLGQRRPRPDRRRGLRPGHLRTPRLAAAPHPLDPHQGDRAAAGGQVPHPARPPVMQLSHHPTRGAAGHLLDGFHRLLNLAGVRRHGQHPKTGQTEHGRTRGSVIPHLGPPWIDGVRHLDPGVPGLLSGLSPAAVSRPAHHASLRRASYRRGGTRP